MTSSRIAAIMSLAVSAALLGTLATAPAYGAYEISPSADTSASQQESVDFSAAPRQMPDTSALNSQIPSDATYVSPDYVTLSDGSMVDATTAQPVNDEKLVGDANKPADPLAKTDGKSFVPITVGEAKQAAGDSAAQDQAQSAPKRMQRSLPLGNGSYGAYWGTYNGTRAFFESDGTLFAQQAKSVIDVSQWQGNIDWQAAKNAGVEGAIIRLSYGWDNGFDTYARRNISECKRLGIPFGVYIYSYAQDAGDGASEGSDVASLLRQAGVSPGDLSYPVFYDLERWTWSGHTPPTSPSVYDGIVNAWYSKLNAAGYHNLSVYSYTSYLNTALNSTNIRSKTRWVASYGARTGFPYSTNDRGWQYSDSGNVNGISGSVDLNAFGNKNYVDNDPAGQDPKQQGAALTDVKEGDYYIVSSYADQVVDIAGSSTADSAAAEIRQYSGAANQVFHIAALGGQRYSIKASQSGKVLSVKNGLSGNGMKVVQNSSTNAASQQWQLYRSARGYYFIKSLADSTKNRFLDVTAGNSANGTPVEIWGLNGGTNQRFRLVPVGAYRPGANGWVTIGNATYWYDNGVRCTSQEIYDPASKGWYYLDASGKRVSGWFTLPDGRRAYYDPKTDAMVHGERYIGGIWYFFDTTGNMAHDKDVWIAAGQKWARYDSQGHMVYGEDFRYGGWYYFDQHTGAMVKGWKFLQSNGGKWVFYDMTTGRMAHGEQCINGNWYYFNDATGATTYGWKKLADGRFVYYDRVTGIMLKGHQVIDGRAYYFDPVTGALHS